MFCGNLTESILRIFIVTSFGYNLYIGVCNMFLYYVLSHNVPYMELFSLPHVIHLVINIYVNVS